MAISPANARRWAEFRARVAEWAKQNPKLAADWDAAREEDEQRERQQQAAELSLNDLRASGFPARGVEAYAKGLHRTPALDAVLTFLKSSKTFLLLMGTPGTGKTLATAPALAGRPGEFVRAVELARLSSFDREDRKRLEAAQRARVLVLDDLGAEMLHDGWKPTLDELVDIRWGERRRTIITTNLDTEAFRARYGSRIADRLRDDGFVVKCGDKSLRGTTR